MEEILQQPVEDVGDEKQLESALLMMSEVFGQAGRLLRQRRLGNKGKGEGRASESAVFFLCFPFYYQIQRKA
jgi:hypothetical protein